jgi:hypothetical protein
MPATHRLVCAAAALLLTVPFGCHSNTSRSCAYYHVSFAAAAAAAAAGALQLALQLHLPHQQLLALLLQPSPAGQRLYTTFARHFNTWLIFNADALLPQLLDAIAAAAASDASAASAQAATDAAAAADAGVVNAAASAQLLLLGALSSLTPAAGSRRQDIRAGSFLSSVYSSTQRFTTRAALEVVACQTGLLCQHHIACNIPNSGKVITEYVDLYKTKQNRPFIVSISSASAGGALLAAVIVQRSDLSD